MANMTFNISPSMNIVEKSFRNFSEQQGSTITSGLIQSNQGQAYKMTWCPNEKIIENNFGTPTNENYQRWFPNQRYLNYVNSLYLIRPVIRRESIINSNNGKRIENTKPTINAQIGIFVDDGRKHPNIILNANNVTNISSVIGNPYEDGNVTIDSTQIKKTLDRLVNEKQELRVLKSIFFYDTSETVTNTDYRDYLNPIVMNGSNILINKYANYQVFLYSNNNGLLEKEQLFSNAYFIINSDNEIIGLEFNDDIEIEEVQTKLNDSNSLFLEFEDIATNNYEGYLRLDGSIIVGNANLIDGGLYTFTKNTISLEVGNIVELQKTSNGNIVYAKIINIDGSNVVTIQILLNNNSLVVSDIDEIVVWNDTISICDTINLAPVTSMPSLVNYFVFNNISNFGLKVVDELILLITQVLDYETKSLESIILNSPNSLFGDEIINPTEPEGLEWYFKSVADFDSSDNYDLNKDFLTIRKLYSKIPTQEEITNPLDIEYLRDILPKFDISSIVEFIPLYPKVNNEFPFVEKVEIDSITGREKYSIDSLRNQELQIYNEDEFDSFIQGSFNFEQNEVIRFIHRWPGDEGNKFYIASVGKDNFKKASIGNGLTFSDIFQYGPKSYDEMCFVLLKENESGYDVINKYLVSLKPDKKDINTGLSMFIEDVINKDSEYIYVLTNKTYLSTIVEFDKNDNTINPNINILPYENSTLTHYYNRVDRRYKILPKEIDLPTLDPTTNENLTFICNENGIYSSTGSYTGHIWLTGWVKEIDGYFPREIEFVRNLAKFSEGNNGINTDGNSIPTEGDVIEALDVIRNQKDDEINQVYLAGWVTPSSSEELRTICEVRKDMIGFVNIPTNICLGKNKQKAVNDEVKYKNDELSSINSTYMFITGNSFKMYDKYNDTYRWVDTSADVAGLSALIDREAGVHIPFANDNGRFRNVVRLAYNPDESLDVATNTEGLRDILWKNRINPIFNMKGVGSMLFGNLSTSSEDTPYAEIQIRKFMISYRKYIRRNGLFAFFKFNNERTRSSFKEMLDSFTAPNSGSNDEALEAGEGVGYLNICDLSNNDENVRSNKILMADSYLKFKDIIYYIGVNVISTPSGVDIQEFIKK